MLEYIEREAVIDLITRRYENPEICTAEINAIPAADVAPVVKELRPAVRLLHGEYERAKKNPVVRNPMAYALYQVWKAVNDCENGR